MENVSFRKFQSLLTVYMLVTGVVLVSSCTDEDLDRCWEPMANLPDHLNWEAIVPTLSEENMREHCQLFDQVETCLQTLSCSSLQQGLHDGLQSAYHFLCDLAFDKYLEYRVCFNNSNLHTEGGHCNHTLINRLGSLDSSTSVDYRLERICQYANDYLDCVQNAVQAFCGAPASAWQRELDYRSLSPLLSRTGCLLDGDRVYYPQPQPTEDKTKTYIIVGCVVALSVIILLILVALFIMVRNKKKAAANQRELHRGSASGPYLNQVGMDFFPGAGGDLNPGAAGVHAGPLPMKQPPPYNEAPPEYSPYENSLDNRSVAGASSRHSVAGGGGEERGRRADHSSKAPSKAGSVYSMSSSGRSSRGGGHVEKEPSGRGQRPSSRSHRSSSSSRVGDDYF